MADNITKQNKLHWVVKHKTSFKDEEDFLETILMDCGIKQEDIPKFLNPNRSMIHDPFLMKNMEEMVDRIHGHVTIGNKIAILVDSDQDGYVSASVIGQFLSKDIQEKIPEIIYLFHEGKQHGLKYDLIKNFTRDEIDLIIIPDASITVKEYNLIHKNFPDLDIVCLDHHEMDKEYLNTDTNEWISQKEAEEIKEINPNMIQEYIYTDYVLTVNCTDGQYPNPCLSGVGICQKFIEAYKQKFVVSDDCEFKYLDLVAIGIAGDGMDLRPLESRYYLIEGMKKAFQRNKFYNELQERLSDDMKFGRYITSSLWYLTPKVNGVIRFGKTKKKDELGEKEQLFYAILDKEGTVQYKPRRKSKNDPEPELEEHTLAWDAARMSINVKARQDNEVRKYFKTIQEEIEKNHLDKNSIIFVDGTDAIERGESTGLVANKLTSTYNRPVVLMREYDSETYGGSCRGYESGPIKDLKGLLNSFGANCAGHSNACGFSLKKELLDEVIQKCNEVYPIETLYTEYKCDWEIPANKMKREYVQEVAEHYDIWGGPTIPEPTFVITNLVIPANEINAFGENKNFIRFTYNGISFTKKYCGALDYDTMICKQRTTIGKPKYKVRLNLICQFVLNAWEDKINPEVKILYFDSVKDDGSVLDDFFDDNINTRTNIRISANGNFSRRSNSGIKEIEPPVIKSSTEDLEEKKVEKEESIKKKRGRPPKKREPLILDDEKDLNSVPKKRGRPPKNKDVQVSIKMKPVEDIDEDIDEDEIKSKVENKIENNMEINMEEKCENKIEKDKKKVYSVEDEDFVF